MKITEKVDWKLCVSDFETMKECMDFGFLNPDTGEWHEFEISAYKNDLYDLVKFYNRENWDYIVYFNGIGFDGQVMQFVLNNYKNWFDLTNLEIVEKIYGFVQKMIFEQRFINFKPYRESDFEIPVIDVFTMLGLDNLARSTSLKKIQFQLDMPNVEEMPIHHSKEDLTQEEIQLVKDYRRNDVTSTFTLFKLCLGDTEHPIYKGNNQVELRLGIKEDFGINCISYSDIKIGDELMKVSYMKATGLEAKELPRKGYFRREIRLSECIPSYVKFETKQFQDLLKATKKEVVKQNAKYERSFSYGSLNTKYTIGLGGGHSVNKNEKYKATEDELLLDVDVSSLYPALIVNLGLFPKHLGKQLLTVYSEFYHKRLELKPLSKNDKKIKGIVDAIKLLLNSIYGC